LFPFDTTRRGFNLGSEVRSLEASSGGSFLDWREGFAIALAKCGSRGAVWRLSRWAARLGQPPTTERGDDMAHTTADILAVQSRLQDLLETMPPAQAMLLEAVVAGTPIEVQPDAADTSPDADDRAIIIVSGRGTGRWLLFDLSDVLAELNPQPLPPDPPEVDPFR